MATNDKINAALRAAFGQPVEVADPPAPEPEPAGLGSADGGSGMGSQPRESTATKMNREIRKAWKRRRGGL